jgi:Zn ribbon nucleic-acid-binding protein
VRYGFMARELSQQAEKELKPTRQRVDATTEVARPATQDLDLLAVWSENKVREPR